MIAGIYAVVWGAGQLITGPLSDRIGRKRLIVAGMMLCGAAVWVMPHADDLIGWSVAAALTGVGMAMLYPTLGAAVADFSPAHQRAALLGVYRFWRDFGYALGALVLGVAAQWLGVMENVFVVVGISMMISALIVFYLVPEDVSHG